MAGKIDESSRGALRETERSRPPKGETDRWLGIFFRKSYFINVGARSKRLAGKFDESSRGVLRETERSRPPKGETDRWLAHPPRRMVAKNLEEYYLINV